MDLILTVNAGSNSLKCAAYELDGKTLCWRFTADRIHEGTTATITNSEGEAEVDDRSIDSGYGSALRYFQDWLEKKDVKIIAAGHRVVHGGHIYEEPVEISAEVIANLEDLIAFAPSHQPYNLELVAITKKLKPDIPQIACFDTSFHRGQPWIAQQFALPRELVEENHYYRYGFHGLSYEYIAGVLPQYVDEDANRVLVVHLGSGTSACSILDGQSVATTMGLTALDGLMMSTRCGYIDPGVILDLIKNKNMDINEVEELLYNRSGLKGISGMNGDMRDIEKSKKQEAQEAVDLFCYMAARQLGGLIPAMGGIDALVFTGAMGGGDPMIRAKICDYFKWLGAKLEPQINQTNGPVISSSESSVKILALPTDEESVIAWHAACLM